MTQEQFEALGIEKNLAGKAAEASKKELEGYVSKDTYDQLEQQKNQLETSVNDYKTQMETLKTAAGDNEDLKNQIGTASAAESAERPGTPEGIERAEAHKCH